MDQPPWQNKNSVHILIRENRPDWRRVTGRVVLSVWRDTDGSPSADLRIGAELLCMPRKADDLTVAF